VFKYNFSSGSGHWQGLWSLFRLVVTRHSDVCSSSWPGL